MKRIPRVFVLFAVLWLAALPAAAHFNLNVNIRIILVEHLDDGLRIFLRLPAPYVLANLIGAPRADGTVEPAPYTRNRIIKGELMHLIDSDALRAEPLGLGKLVAEGHQVLRGGAVLPIAVEGVRVYPALQQPPFATLEEARAAFQNPVFPPEAGDVFVGDSVIDVQLRIDAGEPVYSYSLKSTLDPGLPGTGETANLIIDDFAGEVLIFRETGLLAKPVEVTRSALKAAVGFVIEGVRHILSGYDHVLFVLCIAIGAAGFGNLLWRVTGFTLGHTVTLILGFFGYVPQGAWFVPAVELGIALSIIYAAAVAVLQRPGAGTIAVTSGIGLLHGLGFSFVLHEILRLDSPNLWQSLISFNVGVELGQVAIVAVVFPVFWWLARRGEAVVAAARWAVALPCMVVAGVWVAERAILFVERL